MTRKRSPSFQFYADDFLAGTCDMSMEEVGAYIRLLCAQWSKQKLRDDAQILMRIMGATPQEFDRIWPVLSPKFGMRIEDGIGNPRLEAVRDVQLTRSKNGSKGGKAKGKQKPSKTQAKKAGVRSMETGDGDGDRKEEMRIGDGEDAHSDFDRFWAAFPSGRKTDKARARKAWESAIKKADPEVIITAAAEYAKSPLGRGQYVKGPAPWLNGHCWEDDRQAWQRNDAIPERTRRNLQSAAAFVNGENLF